MDSLLGPLADMFPDEVLVEKWLSTDGYGNDVFDAPFPVSARVTGEIKKVLGDDGEEHTSKIKAILSKVINASEKDRFTLPERFTTHPEDPTELEPRQPEALSVRRSTDEHGPHHETVFF